MKNPKGPGSRTKKKKDGTPHTIDEDGRTCTTCEDKKLWSEYRTSKGSWTGHVDRCTSCTNIMASKTRKKRKKAKRKSVNEWPALTAMNALLMRKWI